MYEEDERDVSFVMVQMQEEMLDGFQFAFEEAEAKVRQHPEILEELHYLEELRSTLENAREHLEANKVMYSENASHIKSVLIFLI